MNAENSFKKNQIQYCRNNSFFPTKTYRKDCASYEKEVLRYSKLLETVLKGIPDIIGVYEPNNTILFYNQAGYDFYNVKLEEVKGKKCYEILGRDKRCTHCTTEKAIQTKQMIRTEKYIPELNKYMDCCCNPVLDDSGEVILLIEQLKDITEKKILEKVLKENENNYEQIVHQSPHAIIIIVDNKITLANKEASEQVRVSHNELLGSDIWKWIIPKHSTTLKKRMNQIVRDGQIKTTFDYKIMRKDNVIIDVEVTSSFLLYHGKPAIQCIIRDITDFKKSLNKAAILQRQSLDTSFPLENKVNMETIYVPAKTVSGDFFRLQKINEDLVIGILADVSGKGISAALHISAFDVLFHEAILVTSDPLKILNELNKKIGNYLGENYIAACCFSLDFKKREAKIGGAGINEFIFQKKNHSFDIKIVKGCFLGMFHDSIFDEEIIPFDLEDKFYFFTDGLDFIFNHKKIKNQNLESRSVIQLKNYVQSTLTNMLSDIKGIKDDCTLLALEMK